MISLKNITKNYHSGKKTVRALKNININLPQKGLVFIVGKSGSGKSTLLNIVGGLDQMSEGEVIINGVSTKNFRKKDFDAFRNYYVGFVFQEFNLIDEASVYENVSISLKIQEKNHTVNNIEDSLNNVELNNLGYRKPSELSGGQRQRIATARALVKNPKIILADEPTGALDSNTGDNLIKTFKRISKERLVIVVSHETSHAYRFADRIIELKDGEIVSDVIRAKEESNIIEEYDKRLFRIMPNNKLDNLEFLKPLLANNKTNYLCLTNELNKTILAYPEAFDKLKHTASSKNEFIDFVEKEELNVEKLNLPKTGISLKETSKMAFLSIKKKKIRFFLSSLLSIFCLTFLFIVLTIQMISSSKLTYNTLKKEKTDTVFMQKSNGRYENLNINENELKNLGINNFGRYYNMTVSPELSSVSKNYNNDFNGFNGFCEIDDVSAVGLRMEAGSNILGNYKEIIISDFAAFYLNYYGFVGDDNGMKIISKPHYRDLVGTKVYLQDELFTIKGIFKTDFKENDSHRFHNYSYFYYSTIYVKKDFIRIKMDNYKFLVSETIIIKRDNLTERKLKDYQNSGYYAMIFPNENLSVSLEDTLESVKAVFLVLTLVFAIFALLVIMNFIGSSIGSRRKEIGILRALGAKNRDVLQIFLNEIIYLVCFVTIFIALLVRFIFSIINSSLNYIGITIFQFNIISIIQIIIITFAFYLLAALLPLQTIIWKKPLDNIKRE